MSDWSIALLFTFLAVAVYVDAKGIVFLERVGCRRRRGKSAHYSRHPKCSQNCLISVELVLLYMFHTIFLMGN